MDKRKVYNLDFEVDLMGMALDTAYSLGDEMDITSEHFKKELEAGNEISVEELVRKLNFFSNMLSLQLTNLNEHTKNLRVAVKDLRNKDC